MNDGLEDLQDGLRRFHLWTLLAWRDVKQTNTRTRLGVFWHAATFFVVGAGIGVLYAEILGQPKDRYVPYIAAGLLAWNFINAPFSEGLSVLVRDRGIITQVPTPFTLYVFRFVGKGAMILSLSLLGYLLVLLSFALLPTPHLLPFAFACALYLLTASAVTLILSIATVFHRWIPNLVPSIMRLAFFVTPVLWMPDMILAPSGSADAGVDPGLRAAVVVLNPLYHYLEIFRGPLIGYDVAPLSWLVALLLTVSLCIAAIAVLARTKTRVLVNL